MSSSRPKRKRPVRRTEKKPAIVNQGTDKPIENENQQTSQTSTANPPPPGPGSYDQRSGTSGKAKSARKLANKRRGSGVRPRRYGAQSSRTRRSRSSARFSPNGIDATTGSYLLSDLSAPQLEALAKRMLPVVEKELPSRLDPGELDQAGWAVVFAADDPQRNELRRQLAPLLKRRRRQAGELYRELEVQPGDTKARFLARAKAAAGPANPQELPYYLLLVGGPEQISFELQYGLEVSYAVGRVAFDRPEDYRAYAESVVAAELKPPRPRTATVFGVENNDDETLALAAEHLVTPLLAGLRQAKQARGWELADLRGQAATRKNLQSLLSHGSAPALLFTASHGIGYPLGHRDQANRQGALLCADWPGPKAWNKALKPSFSFAASDVPQGGSFHGLIAFLFACHGAGVPEFDAFSFRNPGPPERLAPRPFLSALPQALLAQEGGGALAVIGHIERAWACSFLWGGVGGQPEVFTETVLDLLHGHRVGFAMRNLNLRYSELATELTEALVEAGGFTTERSEELVSLWIAHNDARSYVLLGDPAVRLAVPFPTAKEV